MSVPYTEDLRIKALEAVNRGEGLGRTAEMFGIARSTLYRWRKQQSETGQCAAKTGYSQSHLEPVHDL